MFEPVIYTVKQFNELVNTTLNRGIGESTIQGEVSEYKVSQGKWVTFKIKDKESILDCFAALYQMDLPLKDGQEVLVTGTPRVYVPYGKYSLTVRSVELRGEGALQKAFEELKAKLELEGLFAPIHKKELPRFPETIGVITSGEGAAINDIRKVIDGRWGGVKIVLLPVVVQGANAPDSLVNALNYFNQYQPVDVIIFGRGGGSLEDLQAFNSERVARAVFSSRIPIIAGIGHEHNTSIADLVADVRAATPSNAAEIAVPDRQTIAHELSMWQRSSEQLMKTKITHLRHDIHSHQQTLHLFIQQKVHTIRLLLQTLQQRIDDMPRQFSQTREQVKLMQEKVVLAFSKHVELAQQRYASSRQLLKVLNPTAILQRGYTITYDDSGKPITTLSQVPKQGTIKTQLSDGTFITHIDAPSGQASLF